MASPQTEKGYTRIANEILERIVQSNLNGTQFRIVMTIWRYTYGFRKKQSEMTITFFAQKLDANKRQVDRELKTLIQRKIIKVEGMGTKGARLLSFNKDYDEWLDRIPEGREGPTILEEGEIPISELKKEPKKKYGEDSTYFKMAVYFHDLVLVVGKEAGVEHLIRNTNLQSWADDFRKLVELDGVDKHLAKDVMDWVTKDNFWKTNVLSAKKLREKFTELSIKMHMSRKPALQKKSTDSRDKDIEFQRWVAEGNDPDAFDWGS
ncbi:replication protein [Peribacillus alkalitolerans]|uniref:replication protein n=1 Tax=Peribacillus alkalitolerans TaxID=1550385 RepID=UPI0013D54ABB|nr:replication protein [Peribacillus alkalitolerans]